MTDRKIKVNAEVLEYDSNGGLVDDSFRLAFEKTITGVNKHFPAKLKMATDVRRVVLYQNVDSSPTLPLAAHFNYANKTYDANIEVLTITPPNDDPTVNHYHASIGWFVHPTGEIIGATEALRNTKVFGTPVLIDTAEKQDAINKGVSRQFYANGSYELDAPTGYHYNSFAIVAHDRDAPVDVLFAKTGKMADTDQSQILKANPALLVTDKSNGFIRVENRTLKDAEFSILVSLAQGEAQ